jgi:diguanylate cyclase (GGDEF)-like protein
LPQVFGEDEWIRWPWRRHASGADSPVALITLALAMRSRSNPSNHSPQGSTTRSKDDSLDSLTGLVPRRLGEMHLQTLAVTERATTLDVPYIDADHFKDVNDTFGHKTGDEVLHMVGQSMANGLRRGDVPVRWGGEEFLALLHGIDQVGLDATAERVRMLAENSWIQKGEVQVRVTVSVGATMALPTDTADELVDRADKFMYASKQGGRNRVTTDTGELTSGAERPILGTAAPWLMPAGRTQVDLSLGDRCPRRPRRRQIGRCRSPVALR